MKLIEAAITDGFGSFEVGDKLTIEVS